MGQRSYRCDDCAWNYTGPAEKAVEQARIHRLIHRRRVERYSPLFGCCVPDDDPDDESDAQERG